MLYKLYRVSDAGRPKRKLSHATKLNCLRNFIDVFGDEGLVVFADNCTAETINDIQSLGIRAMLTCLGNSGSFRYALNYALENFKDDDHVYMIEDDYWHLPQARQALFEGLSIADYTTLYDFPDKYVSFPQSPNPYIDNNSELCRVFLTKTCHWKTSNSTTMTFAAKVSTLRSDSSIIRQFTQDPIPDDFSIFLALTQQSPWPLLRHKKFRTQFFNRLRFARSEKRVLITALPGLSTHVEYDYLSPHTDWESLVNEFSLQTV